MVSSWLLQRTKTPCFDPPGLRGPVTQVSHQGGGKSPAARLCKGLRKAVADGNSKEENPNPVSFNEMHILPQVKSFL